MGAFRLAAPLLLVLAAVTLRTEPALANPHEEAERKTYHELRLLRIQIYDTYRTQRAEYDRRKLAAESVWQSWKDAGSDPQQSNSLTAWLRNARSASRPQVMAALPAAPHFQFVQRPHPAGANAVARRHDSGWPTGGPQQIDASRRAQLLSAQSSPSKESSQPHALRGVGRALVRGFVFGTLGPQDSQ